ncbi:MAG: hypothetical protein VYE62_09115, partial [Pseudomonadota bacterium]|nr:hypothetical protein [Pseudomonadota bacterium]
SFSAGAGTMKMTIVIDSEDREGIKAALDIARLMHTQYVGAGGFNGQKESFGKIEFIKVLRKFMRESVAHMKDEQDGQVKDIDDLANLRNAKRFADRIFLGER